MQRRIKDYEVKKLNDPRPGKKLLVLDVDYTLFDHRSNAERADELRRPYLHEFLAEAYKNYDIVIWCEWSTFLYSARNPIWAICEQDSMHCRPV